MNGEEEGQAQRWNKERRFDRRLLKIAGVVATLMVLGLKYLPFPYNEWCLYVGLSLAIPGALLDLLWVGPRQIRRLREMSKSLESAAQEHGVQSNGQAEPAEDEDWEDEES